MLDGRILEFDPGLMGYVSFFENFIQIVVLLFAWIVVLLAFFILAIQLFITLIEFKLTTLAGFVLIPFGLFGKTAFAAERVLGNVISSGVKVLVLAVIVGIGSTLFSQFTAGFGGNQPTIDNAMALGAWGACPFLALAFSVLALPTVSYRADRNSVPARRSAPAWPQVAPSWLAPVSQPAVPDWQVAHSSAVPVVQPAIAGGAATAYRAGGLSGVASAGGSAIVSPLRRMAAGFGGGSSTADCTTGLGTPHEARADREPGRVRGHPCRPQR